MNDKIKINQGWRLGLRRCLFHCDIDMYSAHVEPIGPVSLQFSISDQPAGNVLACRLQSE
jgi:hypothetical protein